MRLPLSLLLFVATEIRSGVTPVIDVLNLRSVD